MKYLLLVFMVSCSALKEVKESYETTFSLGKIQGKKEILKDLEEIEKPKVKKVTKKARGRMVLPSKKIPIVKCNAIGVCK